MVNIISKYLNLSSLTIIAVTTVLLISWVIYQEKKIVNLDSRIDDLTKKIKDREFNIDMASNQFTKITSTYGSYSILESVNSQRTSEFKDKLKRQMMSAITVVSGGGIYQKELEKYNINSLQSIFLSTNEIKLKELNDLEKQKEELNKTKEGLLRSKNNFIIALGIIQGFGLFLGILAEFFNS